MKLELFLNKFLAELEKKKIDYCVLRNYETFPKKWVADDIDILINKDDLKLITKIIQKYSNIIYFYQRDYLAAFALQNITRHNRNYFKIDFLTKLGWKGLSFLDNETVFKNKVKFKNIFFVPQKHHETIITLFSSYLVGGWVNKKYQKNIRNEFIKNKKNISKGLELKLSKLTTYLICQNIINNNMKMLSRILIKIKVDLVLFYIKRNPFDILLKILNYYIQEIKIRFSSYAIVRVQFIYKNKNFKNKIRKFIIEDIKSFFAFSLNYDRKDFLKKVFSKFFNPYGDPLLLIDELSKLEDQKENGLLLNFNKPDLKIKINSKDLSNLKKNKNRIIKFLELKTKQRFHNEVF